MAELSDFDTVNNVNIARIHGWSVLMVYRGKTYRCIRANTASSHQIFWWYPTDHAYIVSPG